ncbi:hypothetical protein [Brachybacterium sp. AOP3-A1-3]|uniref:hypothetical protein n=1 Tax=Brachybacterium sp. AOP3-A1-3 TaxID=3457699 RepID=UPI004033EDD2
MNDLIIAAATLHADGTIQAESIFETINGIAGDAKSTALTLFGAAFYVGAAITWAANKFSVKSGIVALLLVAIGTAVLGQVDSISGMFGETIQTEASASTEQPASSPTEDSLVTTLHESAAA